MSKLCRWVIKIFAVVAAIACFYMMISFGGANSNIIDIYTSLTATRQTSDIQKRMRFVSSYTSATGDISFAMNAGYTQEEAEVMQTEGQNFSSSSGGSSNSPDPGSLGSYSDQDLRPLAQAVAASSLTPDVMQVILPNAGKEYYCTGCGGPWTADYNGSNVSLGYRCCTTLVQGVERFLGNDAFLSVMGNSYLCSAWVSYTSGSPNRLNGSGLIWGDLQVGDVLLRAQHTEIIVYKEGNTVYVGNMGGDSSIVSTSQQGYAYTKDAGQAFTEFTYVLRY